MKRNLIVDISNIAWITYFSKKQEYDKDLLAYKILESISYVAGEYAVDGIIVACDSGNVWRRDVYPGYKQKRDYDENALEIKEVLKDLQTFFNECTNIPAVSVDRAESDDIISVFVQETDSNPEIFNIILSNDRDFFQLLSDKTVLHSPRKDQGGMLEYDTSNKDYDLFVKCIRGDNSDSILSAYPRIRETKLKEAWNDSLEMMNIMSVVPEQRSKTVKELYEFNKKLIDLTQQPKDIRQSIVNELKNVNYYKGNFSRAKVLGWFGTHNLVKARKNIDTYTNLLKKRVIF